MSYIANVRPHVAAQSVLPRPASPPRLSPRPAVPSPSEMSGRLSTGLEVALLLAFLGSISLVLCTIAAGAL